MNKGMVLHFVRPIAAVCWLVGAFGMGSAVFAQPLVELHRQAVASDPALSGAQAQVRAASERVEQAAGILKPNVSLNASLSRSEHRDLLIEEQMNRSFFTRQYALQINQALYRPGAWRGLAQSKVLLDAAALQRDTAFADLTQRVTAAFFDVLMSRSELEQIKGQKQATNAQLAVARRSFYVGTVSITDVREAEAKFDNVVAQEGAAELDIQAKELVGGAAHVVHPRQASTTLPPLARGDLEHWLQTAEESSPQINQARRALDAATIEVDKAKTGAYPTIDLTFSHQENASSGSTLTALPQSGRTQQAGITLTIPLYAGGGISAKVRESLAQEDKAASDLEAARKGAASAVRQTFFATLVAMAQFKGLLTAERSAETSLKANKRGYEVGMRINADVLAAQSQLYQTRRDKVRAWNEAWVNYIKLKSAVGVVGDADLAEIDQLLVQGPRSSGAPDQLARDTTP